MKNKEYGGKNYVLQGIIYINGYYVYTRYKQICERVQEICGCCE